MLSALETPTALIDLAILESNLASMQRLADRHQVTLRPHAKTHKSLEIGTRQMGLGASGLTVATVDEALVFLNNGFKSITISRPILSDQTLDRLFGEQTQPGADLRIVVDSEPGIRVASQAASRANDRLGVFIKIDVGLRRCGVDPDSPAPIELALQIISAPGLDFRGILSHAGQVYAADSREQAVDIAEAERLAMLRVRDALIGEGIDVPEVSVGSTPTVLAAPSFEGITEIRPGNYVFLDLLPIKVGVASEAEVAFSVLATIISKNSEYFITDAGSKILSSDTGGHGLAGAQGFGVGFPIDRYLSSDHRLPVVGLSEEHGKLARTDFDLPIGTKVRIIPNHACPVANLARRLTVMAGDQIEIWPVDA
jgi:D-serine deaminase-like pyridoxal phosphate-dependent protein